MYKKFYFLHIPKTSGRFCKENVVVPLLETFTKNKISFQLFPSHANWDTSYIDNNTYIFSIFRDPIKRMVSHYCHDIVLDNEGKRKIPVGKAKEINRDLFLSWVQENEIYLTDFQAKNIFLEDNKMNHEIKSFFNFKLTKEEKNNVIKKIKKINLFIRAVNLNKNDCLLLQNKILLDFNLYPRLENIEFFDNQEFYNQDSSNLFKTLNNEDILYLNSLNSFDLEIYNNNSYFWNNKI
jgi:hypothetical protein